MFMASLLRIAEMWKQPRCPSVGMDEQTVTYLNNGILVNTKKKKSYELDVVSFDYCPSYSEAEAGQSLECRN